MSIQLIELFLRYEMAMLLLVKLMIDEWHVMVWPITVNKCIPSDRLSNKHCSYKWSILVFDMINIMISTIMALNKKRVYMVYANALEFLYARSSFSILTSAHPSVWFTRRLDIMQNMQTHEWNY